MTERTFEHVKLTDRGNQLMARHGLSKKAVSLTDHPMVSMSMEAVAIRHGESREEFSANDSADSLAEYLAELESTVADTRAVVEGGEA